MASSHFLFILSTTLLLLLSSASAARPKALIVPVSKDPTTGQYIARVYQRTPQVLTNLVVHLGGRDTWVDCESGFVSSTYRPVRCRSAECSLANSNACSDKNVCGSFPENPFTRTSTGGDLAVDVLSANSTNGFNPGPLATDPSFIFTCAPSFLLEGLAKGAVGVATLGRNKVSAPSQLAAAFSFDRTFALCLSSGNGVIFFGDEPYALQPIGDVSGGLIYTPLLINPVSTAGTYTQGEKSVEYFIGVKSIKVNGNVVPVNKTLLTIDSNGIGGTKISTVERYTTLETSIYRALLKAFRESISAVPTVPAVAPFGLCYEAARFGSTRVGLAVPQIDLVLQNESVYWRIFGANSMVFVSEKVVCLGFVDGGAEPRTAIVIGGYQIEDNLLQFDIATSRLGFSSSLLFRQTTCSNFNFTSSS